MKTPYGKFIKNSIGKQIEPPLKIIFIWQRKLLNTKKQFFRAKLPVSGVNIPYPTKQISETNPF